MIEIKDGVLKVTAIYSLKVPVNQAGYAMQDMGAVIGCEVALPEAYDTALMAKDANSLFAELANGVKLAVFAQLGTDFDTIDGVLKPKVVETPKESKPRGGSGTNRGGSRGGSSSQRQFAPAKSAGRDMPIVVLDGVEYFDQRPLKADGTFKEGTADFRGTKVGANGRAPQLWIYSKDGELNEGVADLLDEAQIPWE